MACVLSWLGNWSPEQRQRLVTTMGQLEAGPGEEDLLAGMRGLGLHRGNQPGSRKHKSVTKFISEFCWTVWRQGLVS